MKANLRLLLVLLPIAFAAVSCKFIARKISVMYRDSWDNGLTKREGPTENGLQTGEWTYYYESGQRRARGRYEEDHRVGPWTHYYESGIVEWTGEFDDKGRRSGEWNMNYPDETLRARGKYVADAEDGAWEFFWPDGSIQRRGSFDAGKLSGLWRYYHKGGKLQAEGICHRGQRIGMWRVFDEQGKEGTKDFGLRPGIAVITEYWPAGTRRRTGVLENGVPVGCWATFYENGKPRMACTFRSGKPAGPFAANLPDGNQLAYGTIEDGKFGAGCEAITNGAAMPIAEVLVPAFSAQKEWLTDEELTAASAEQTIATLIGEAVAPRDENVPAAPVGEPAVASLPAAAAEDVLEEVAEAPERIAAPMQPDWTVTEREELDSYVQRYLEGPSKSRASRKKYGPPGSPQRKGPGRRAEIEGKMLPRQVFTRVDGGTIDLTSLRGKKRVLMVILRGFVGEVCVYCVAQTEALAQCRAQLDELDIEVVVVYPGPRENQASFTKAYEMTFGKGAPPYGVFYDDDLTFVEELGISGDLAFPTTLIVDKAGKVEYAFVGAHRADRPAAKKLIELIKGMKQ